MIDRQAINCSGGRDVFGLANYRLRERRPDGGVFDFLDPECEMVIGVACPEVVETAKREPPRTVEGRFFSDRLFWIYAPFSFLFFLAGLILGRGSLFPVPSSRPRLIVRRSDGGIVLTLRVSSGLLYDSRRVYDGQGRLIAHFRSFKSSVRGGFNIVDLRDSKEDDKDLIGGPWLGLLEPSGDVFLLRLATNPEAGRIVPQASPDDDQVEVMGREGVDHYDIDASSALRQDEAGEILLLAAALAVAWRPPPG